MPLLGLRIDFGILGDCASFECEGVFVRDGTFSLDDALIDKKI